MAVAGAGGGWGSRGDGVKSQGRKGRCQDGAMASLTLSVPDGGTKERLAGWVETPLSVPEEKRALG